ncbi:MAG: cation-translocating P-type ATPase, partial [Lachnospiraceae bacterium]
VSLAVAAIPEGLAAVVTVVLSIGVTNMSKRRAIIRKLTAVETLGCAQIICSDKTGTLTQNKMTVVEHFGDDEKETAKGMALCSDAELLEDGSVNGEPTEAALVAFAHTLKLDKPALKEEHPRFGEAPFDSNRKLMSTVHPAKDIFVQYTKGAPDVLIARCDEILKDGKCVPITEADRKTLLAKNKEMADQTLRVLALAKRTYRQMPKDLSPEALEEQLCFVGLVGMKDPIRPEVAAAMEECREAGIRPIMITGDHVDTAAAIGRELGILGGDIRAISGSELDAMDDATFEKEFQKIGVYARVQPEHKTRIVNAWRKAGYVTAMTGDGVNDAPSIKAADIGVGMGITGTDVTKNVADMVLADDNFATIVGAVEEGRRIYDNIRKAIQFLLGSNLSEVIAIFVASLCGFTILKPVHLLWINLLTDTFPALALGTEKAEPDIMKRKPRDSKDGIFAGGMGGDILYQGILVACLVFVSYLFGVYFETGEFALRTSAHGMTMAFLTMSFAEILHSFNMRSRIRSIFQVRNVNKTLLLSAVVGVILTTLVAEVPFLANAFGFVSVGLKEYFTALALALIVVVVVEIVKAIRRAIAKT